MFSPDDRWLVSTGDGCQVWSVSTWKQQRNFSGDFWGVAFSPNGKVALALETGDGVVRFVDPTTGRDHAVLEDPGHDRANHLVFSPDATKLVAITLDRAAVHVWDLRAPLRPAGGHGTGRRPVLGRSPEGVPRHQGQARAIERIETEEMATSIPEQSTLVLAAIGAVVLVGIGLLQKPRRLCD